MSNRSSAMNLPHVQSCPAMIHDGVPKPAIGHGGVLCICPAMHWGGAKRPRFANTFQTGQICIFFQN